MNFLYAQIVFYIRVSQETKIHNGLLQFVPDERFHNFFEEKGVLEADEGVELMAAFLVINLLLFVEGIGMPVEKVITPIIELYLFCISEVKDLN